MKAPSARCLILRMPQEPVGRKRPRADDGAGDCKAARAAAGDSRRGPWTASGGRDTAMAGEGRLCTRSIGFDAEEDAHAAYVATTQAVGQVAGEGMLAGGLDGVFALRIARLELPGYETQPAAIRPDKHAAAGCREVTSPADFTIGMAQVAVAVGAQQAQESRSDASPIAPVDAQFERVADTEIAARRRARAGRSGRECGTEGETPRARSGTRRQA